MKKKLSFKLKSLLLLIALNALVNYTRASHMLGADMSYSFLGNGKYKITAKVYRDCRGVPMGIVSFKAFAGINGSSGCGTVTPTTLTRTSIKDISNICSTANAPCNPQNTYGTGQGVEEHTFEAIVDFKTSPLNTFVNKSSCCEVTFYINECCRNGAITTGPAGNDFYSSCMINICNIQKSIKKSNSSPIYTTPPTAFLCCNTPWYFNNGALDTIDFDSISYKLVPGLSNVPNTSVNYTAPFSFEYPMTPYCVPNTSIKCTPNPNANPPTGFYFDSTNGNIVATPTKCDEVPLIVIEQTEWRKDSATGKWIVVGKSRRDMQLTILENCNNNKQPIISGDFNITICEGTKYCQKIKITDETFTPNQTVPDTVVAQWNNGILGGTFTAVDNTSREKEYEFCWQTKIGDARPNSYQFTVTATDQHCSPPAITVRAFKVKVVPQISALVVNQDPYLVSIDSNAASFRWLDCNNNYSPVNAPSANNYRFKPENNGKYAVEITNGNCKDTSLCYDFNSLGLEDLHKSSVAIFPNPFKNEVKISATEKITKIEVYDLLGKLAFKMNVNKSEMTLNLAELTRGTYLLKVHFANKLPEMKQIIKD